MMLKGCRWERDNLFSQERQKLHLEATKNRREKRRVIAPARGRKKKKKDNEPSFRKGNGRPLKKKSKIRKGGGEKGSFQHQRTKEKGKIDMYNARRNDETIKKKGRILIGRKKGERTGRKEKTFGPRSRREERKGRKS